MKTRTLLAACVATAMIAGSAGAALVSQFGVLDLNANGGINPNTGAAWQAGDTYRLAFYTADGIAATSNDPTVYDDFATTQAQQNGALAGSTGWTSMTWVNLDSGAATGTNVSDWRVRAGINDTTDGAGVGGAGAPVYAMDGSTAIARNNADIFNAWSNPFDGDSAVRIDSSSTESGQSVHYSPFLDQFAAGDSGDIHGESIWTGGFTSAGRALGEATDDNNSTWGSSNANSAGRVHVRFNSAKTSELGVYAISEELTVVPEPGSLALLGLGGLLIARRRRG